jgi:hypothetical protein
MTPEEQFRQVMSTLNIPKVQLEAICDLHSAVYEAMDLKGIYDKLSHLDNYPKISKAIKLGGAALIGGCPVGGVYNTDWNKVAEGFGGADKPVEQYIDQPDSAYDEQDTVFDYKDKPGVVDTNFTVKTEPKTEPKAEEPPEPKETPEPKEEVKEDADDDLVRDTFLVKFPTPSPSESSDDALRKFMMTNLSSVFKETHNPTQQAAHIERILRAVKNVAKITSSRGIGEAELLAIMCVESMYNDKPKTTKYRGLAQLGDDAMDDARKYARKFGLDASKMRDPEIVEDAVNLAAGYLLYLMYRTDRSNKVKPDGEDDKEIGNMTYAIACYNGGIGTTKSKYHNNKELSVPMLYRMVERKELTPNQAVKVRGSMKEALSYPKKVFKVLDYFKSIGLPTHFGSGNVYYRKR